MASVLFRDRGSVIEAYNNQGIDTWAIFFDGGRNRFSRGDTVEELQAALDLLESGGSNGVYTLRVYENKEVKSVTPKTEADFAFPFRLNGQNMWEPESRNGNTRSGNYSAGVGKIQQIIEEKVAKKVVEMLEEKKEEPYVNKLGMIGEVLDHPVLGSILEQLALKWLGPGAAQIPPPAGGQIAGIPAAATLATETDLVNALKILKQADPQLTAHLVKLAALSEKDPQTFAYIISILDKINVT